MAAMGKGILSFLIIITNKKQNKAKQLEIYWHSQKHCSPQN